MKGFITVSPVSPLQMNGQRSLSVNIRYIVSVGKIDEATGVITTSHDRFTTRESYEQIMKLMESAQE